ncbi:DUF4870 domain-containing protein [Mariniflexile ostreae]|uniref:DUF4870 domain-containing protein n=1 Tax=Mariniflexile ostreae TaxID=1520892 RepID=A0ABV5FAA4_9FLAO
MLSKHHKNIATFIHLSTLSRFIIPFGSFIGPLILWWCNKEKSTFIDAHGKYAINFQISIFIYTIILGMLAIPLTFFNIFKGFNTIHFNDYNITLDQLTPLLIVLGSLGVLIIIGFLLEIAFIIKASLKAKNGVLYQYPLTIHFIK